MARPKHDGLFYFPFDTDFFSDRKIRSLKVRFGARGIVVYIYILCSIYNDKGYYTEIDDDLFDRITDDTGIAENTARQILDYLCERSMLDGTLLTSVKVLTSVQVQKVFQEAKNKLKRDIKVNPDYWLLNSEETLSFIKFTQNEGLSEKNPSLSEKNPGLSEKNSVNKIKGNKIKENKINNAEETAAKIVSVYEGNIAPITTAVLDDIYEWLDKGVEDEVIIYAIKEAVKQNVRKWVYIDKIIQNNFNAGNKSIDSVIRQSYDYHNNSKDLSIYTDSTDYDYENIERRMQEKYDK